MQTHLSLCIALLLSCAAQQYIPQHPYHAPNLAQDTQDTTRAGQALADGLGTVSGIAGRVAAAGFPVAAKVAQAANQAVDQTVYTADAPTAPGPEAQPVTGIPPKSVARLSATLWRTLGLLTWLFRIFVGKPALKMLAVLHVLFRPGTLLVQLSWRLLVGFPLALVSQFSGLLYFAWLFLGSAALLGLILGLGLAGSSRILKRLMPSSVSSIARRKRQRQQTTRRRGERSTGNSESESVLDRVDRRRRAEEPFLTSAQSSLETTPATTPGYEAGLDRSTYFTPMTTGSASSSKRSPPSLSAILSASHLQTPTIREETEESTESLEGYASVSESDEASTTASDLRRRKQGKQRMR